MVSRKNPSIRTQASFPFQKHPLIFLLQHAHSSRPHATSPSTALPGCRVQGQVPARSGVQRKWFSASGSSAGNHPCIVHLGMAGIPRVPSPMTAGTEDSEHAGPRAFQAWPLHITWDQPKITACPVTLQDKLRLGCHGFCCCNSLSIPGIVTFIPLVPPHPSPQPLTYRQFCKSDIACKILPPPHKVGVSLQLWWHQVLPSTLPSRQQLLVAGLGTGCRQPQARVAFWGTKGGSVCTQQSGQMLGMGAAIQGKARRGSDSGLTLPRPRWRDRCPSAEQHPLQGSWGWGGRPPAVSAALPLPEEMPGLLQRTGGGQQAAPSLGWVLAKGTVGSTKSLKAEGLQLLLKVAPSHTHPPLCLEEPPWLHSAEPLPGIASAGRGHAGSTQRQVSSPSSASSPGSQAAGSGSC